MFTIKQTRIILVLTVIITVLISVIGLNLRKSDKMEFEMKARLEVPDIGSGRAGGNGEKVISVIMEEQDAPEDEGKTIILE